MYLIAIAWLFVVLMMALTESSVIAGIMTFIGYCVIPLSLVLYILSSSARRRKIRADYAEKQALARQSATENLNSETNKNSDRPLP
ncbi:MAG: hypothetical protein E6Q34_02270 [Burkholderiaceae bacterium]|nr:MAG: hypothetical protein E6Q34_02270 [Burkholderiaceae bacterium]